MSSGGDLSGQLVSASLITVDGKSASLVEQSKAVHRDESKRRNTNDCCLQIRDRFKSPAGLPELGPWSRKDLVATIAAQGEDQPEVLAIEAVWREDEDHGGADKDSRDSDDGEGIGSGIGQIPFVATGQALLGGPHEIQRQIEHVRN